MKISISSNIERAVRDLATATPRAIEVAAQRALLGTAKAVKDAEVKEMGRVFDRPTRWTLNSFRVVLDKPKTEARVEVKDGYWYRADSYLQAQIEGLAARRQKAFEKALQAVGALPAGWVAVPGERAKLDAYGNQSVGEIRQILSWFDAAERVAGSTQNMGFAGREKRRKGAKKKAGWEYFVVRPGDRRQFVRGSGKTGSNKMQPGIYRRTSYAMGSRIEPVIIFVRKATYRPRFDFYGTARRTIDREFGARFDAALRQSLDRGRA